MIGVNLSKDFKGLQHMLVPRCVAWSTSPSHFGNAVVCKALAMLVALSWQVFE